MPGQRKADEVRVKERTREQASYPFFDNMWIEWQYSKAKKFCGLQTPFQPINATALDLHLVTIPSTQTMFPIK